MEDEKIITCLADYIGWVKQLNENAPNGKFAFRGLSSLTYAVSASAYRRYPQGVIEETDDLSEYAEDLLRDAQKYDFPELTQHGGDELKMLAELQHFGAATPFIDFTLNAFVALHFALAANRGASKATDKAEDGCYVVALDIHETTMGNALSAFDNNSNIGIFYNAERVSTPRKYKQILEDAEGKLVYWQPPLSNNRIIAQKSLFIFGKAVLKHKQDYRHKAIISAENCVTLQSELRAAYGDFADLFPDLTGFALYRAQHTVPYIAETAEGFAEELNKQGLSFYLNGQYGDALPLFERALEIRKKVLGENDPDTANSLNNLASLYKAQVDYDKALPLYKRALAIYEKTLGKDHPDTANSLNNLALLYNNQRDYDKALPLCQRALAIREKALGEDHPDTAISLNNVAGLYDNRGEYDKALPLYKRALAIREKALGENHPDTATILNNLASLYDAQGNYGAALPLYKRALAMREKALGKNHPDTANSLNNLALLYKAQGDYDKALPLYQRTLAIREKTLGQDHPSTANSLNNLALLYDTQGNYGAALPLLERAVKIAEEKLGADHPTSRLYRENLQRVRDKIKKG